MVLCILICTVFEQTISELDKKPLELDGHLYKILN